MDIVEIEERGWSQEDPYEGFTLTKEQKVKFQNADPVLQDLEMQIERWKVIIDALDRIINNISWRHQTVRNILDIKKFESGF